MRNHARLRQRWAFVPNQVDMTLLTLLHVRRRRIGAKIASVARAGRCLISYRGSLIAYRQSERGVCRGRSPMDKAECAYVRCLGGGCLYSS